MLYPMFRDAPQETHNGNGFNYMQRNSPVAVEHNVSYARSGQAAPSENPASQDTAMAGEESDEDARFLRLAHEALVATSAKSNMMVDPTIQDLLARLRYIQSPHGNPIKHSQQIESNENGQLMIQGFYRGFPDLSTDVFSESRNHPSNAKNEDWKFLIDETESPPNDPETMDKDRDMRKFPCRDCEMSFRRSSDLKRHAKQHLSIPANICGQCGKGFARKDALKRHTGTLTCKRNAEKKLYHTNLSYLRRDRPVSG